MYIAITELKSLLYDYQLAEIVGSDSTITTSAIESAEAEVKSYFIAANNLRHTAHLSAQQYAAWQEYDVDAIFAKTGTARHSLIIRLVQELAAYNICTLANVDILYDKVKDLHDHAISVLERIAGMQGIDKRLILTGVDFVDDDTDGDTDPTTTAPQAPFRMVSRPKFHHE